MCAIDMMADDSICQPSCSLYSLKKRVVASSPVQELALYSPLTLYPCTTQSSAVPCAGCKDNSS